MRKLICVLPVLCILFVSLATGCASIPGYGDLSPTAKVSIWLDEIDLFMADVEAYFVEYKGEATPDELRQAKFIYGIAKRRIVSLMEKLAISSGLTTEDENYMSLIQDRMSVIDEAVN